MSIIFTPVDKDMNEFWSLQMHWNLPHYYIMFFTHFFLDIFSPILMPEWARAKWDSGLGTRMMSCVSRESRHVSGMLDTCIRIITTGQEKERNIIPKIYKFAWMGKFLCSYNTDVVTYYQIWTNWGGLGLRMRLRPCLLGIQLDSDMHSKVFTI